jgi:microcystin-dependent protein
MTQRFTNNARTTLASFLSDSATSLSVAAGTGDLFPEAGATTAGGEDWFKAVLQDETGEIEIIYVYTRAAGSDLLADVVRARENTAARNWASGETVVALRMTARDLEKAFIPSGTKMLFAQSTAPLGWTKLTTHDNAALRVVSGTAGSGGTVDFSTAFTSRTIVVSGSVGSHTLTLAQIPSHEHELYQTYSGANTKVYTETSMFLSFGNVTQATRHWNDRLANADGEIKARATGGGQGHSHTFTGNNSTLNLAVKYVDVIVAQKDA